MTINQIRYFLALAERLNFRVVAESFFITQPTLSRQIANLEEEVGVPLFTRDHQHVELTRAGEVMYGGISEVYRQYERVIRETKDAGLSSAGELALAIQNDQSTAPCILEAVKEFSRLHPQIHVNIFRAPLRVLRNGLLDGSLDAAMIMYLDDLYLQKLSYIPIAEETACLAISSDYAGNYGPIIDGAQLTEIIKKIPLHFVTDDYYAVSTTTAAQLQKSIPADFSQADIRYDGAMESIPLKISAGMCVSILNSGNIVRSDPDIAMLEIAGSTPYQKVLAYNPETQNPILPVFMDILRAVQ